MRLRNTFPLFKLLGINELWEAIQFHHVPYLNLCFIKSINMENTCSYETLNIREHFLEIFLTFFASIFHIFVHFRIHVEFICGRGGEILFKYLLSPCVSMRT